MTNIDSDVLKLIPCKNCGETPYIYRTSSGEENGYVNTCTVKCKCGRSVSREDDRDSDGWSVEISRGGPEGRARHKAITAWNVLAT